ncbi:MAG: SdpI family protein [Patescibacteria group bacterium]|nr:SdpI family protein [Patescibacteria group bacterium]MDD5294332.1 SdpI family protein [Patescibacteria group bacterium]MDD5554051.1 SdpI family protein [Patescibacteria group bacterium]
MKNPIEPTIKTEIFPLLILAATIISSFYFYAGFPERVPTHWDFAGQVNGWGSRSFAFIIPGVMVIMYLLFMVLPFLDPKKEKYSQFKKVYHILKDVILLFMAVIYLATSLNALGYNLPIGIIIPVGVGLLFIIIGNYMKEIKSNWFVGIRTPWTLSSEEVWEKTHRFGGKAFMISGFLIALDSFLPISWRLPVFIVAIILVVFGTIIYSYIVYLKEKKGK